MALRLFRANRVENLLAYLLAELRAAQGDPMRSEVIMVQNPGMATWLARNLADRFGVCAGVEFLFPRRVIQRAFAAALGEDAWQVHAFDQERLVWRILARLPELLELPAFARLSSYLRRDPGDRKRVQLARRIAAVFDQYALYRPEMVLAWDQGQDDDWQAILWREVGRDHDPVHVAALMARFFAATEGANQLVGLPPRLCCFGISNLPPLYLQVLERLGQFIPVHFFLLQPTAEFFGDIHSRREIDRALARRRDHTEDSLLLQEGHPLLASMGRMGRDFQQLLLETTQFQDQSDFREPERKTMLAELQRDMLRLVHRGHGDVASLPLAPDDDSIAIHACHGPMREVEILRDQLMGLLDRDPTLLPDDIVVMMPDVETYAPLIEATFSSEGQRHLPFAIADRRFRGASPAIDAFFRVLDLVGGRAGHAEILDLLALPPIHERFGIEASELETLSDWVASAGIRWGIDAEHRASFDQPASDQNTWRFGFRRLLLGYALPVEDALFEGVLPRDQVEGLEARLLGRFAHFAAVLFACLERLQQRHAVVDWQALLLDVLNQMVAAKGESEWQHQQLRQALDHLVEEAGSAGFSGPIELVALRGLLEDRIEYENEGWNFMAEGITFCAMVPMRSIPFKVVAMIGMNDGAFPRAQRPDSFDKITASPRLGDRSRRSEERYLFLEALLAARERLILTYVGQDIVDNAPLPPSVLVGELIDCLAQSFHIPGETVGDRGAMERRLVLRHPMQGFNPIYFDPSRRPELFSFSKSYFQGACAFVEARQATTPLFSAPFPAVEPQARIALDDLVEFFSKPMEWLLRQRLGFTLKTYERTLEEREPLSLERLEAYEAGSRLLEHLLAGHDPGQAHELIRAGGNLPLGTPGELDFDELLSEVQPLLQEVRSWATTRLPSLDLSLDLGDAQLIGRLSDRYRQGQLWYNFKRLSGKHVVMAWIRHLALCAARPGDQELRSRWLGRGNEQTGGSSVTFRPVPEARAYLADLVKLYRIGSKEPLLFFPKSAWSFAKAEESKALAAARRAWGSETGESSDPHYQRAFRDDRVLEPDFSLFAQPMAGGDFPSLARRVFGPAIEHLEEGAAC